MKIQEWNGKPIKKPGVYSGIPLEIYHSQSICVGASVSSSNLRRVLECNKGSPQHFYNEWSGGAKAEDNSEDEKRYLTIGRAAHHLLLGQDQFRKHFVTRPAQWDSWRTNASKEWREQAQAAGVSVITEADLECIIGMAKSIERVTFRKDEQPLETIAALELLRGEVECSFIWFDEISGLWCKARPDVAPTLNWTDYVDMKTTHSVAAPDIFSTLSSYAYHQQAGLVLQGAQACFGVDIKHCTFVLLFVESKRPYCVRAVALKQEDIALGIQQNRQALALIARCISENRWPGPGGHREIEHFDLPERYRENAKFEIETLSRSADAYRRARPQRKRGGLEL